MMMVSIRSDDAATEGLLFSNGEESVKEEKELSKWRKFRDILEAPLLPDEFVMKMSVFIELCVLK